MNKLKTFLKENKTGYIISTIVLTIGTFLIHLRFNQNNPDWIGVITWLPVVYLLQFILSFGFYLFLDSK